MTKSDLRATMSTHVDIQAIELDGKFWVVRKRAGHKLQRRGPFPSAAAAEAAADQFRQKSTPKPTSSSNGSRENIRMNGGSTMGDIVSFPFPLDDEKRQELIQDLARFSDGILDQKFIKRKYRLTDDVWEKFGADEALIESIEVARLARTRSGATKREKSQLLVVAAPDILSGIMLDSSASPKHRIDSAKTLDSFAANGPGAAPAQDHISIVINLGEDHIERYEKSRAIDLDPNNTDTTPVLTAIATKKDDDSGGGHI